MARVVRSTANRLERSVAKLDYYKTHKKKKTHYSYLDIKVVLQIDKSDMQMDGQAKQSSTYNNCGLQ